MIKRNQFSTKKTSLPKNNQQLAFLFITRNNLTLPLFWEKYFQQQSGLVNIHIYSQLQYNLGKIGDNVTIYTNPNKNFHQDYFELALMLLKKSLKKLKNKYFVILRDDIIPLKPFPIFYQHLLKSQQSSFFYHQQHNDNYSPFFCLTREDAQIIASKNYSFKSLRECLLQVLDQTTVRNFNYVYENFELNQNKINILQQKIEQSKLKIKNLQQQKNSNNVLLQINHFSQNIESSKKIISDLQNQAYVFNTISESQLEKIVLKDNYFFIRAIPKRSNLPQFQHLISYMRDKKHYFIHIPKTGGSTISDVFSNYLDLDISTRFKEWKQLFKNNKILKPELEDYQPGKINNHHIPITFYNFHYQQKLMNDYELFAIVRNPIDKIISVFVYWIKWYLNQLILIEVKRNLKENFKKSCQKIHLDEIYNGNFEVKPGNLNNFIGKVLEDPKYKYALDGHLLPLHYYTHIIRQGQLIPVTQVLFFENLNEDFNNFINFHSLNIPENTLSFVHRNVSQSQLSRKDLTPKSLKLIKEYYHLDFKLFNYE